MAIRINEIPTEKGTFVVEFVPADEDGVALNFGQLKNPKYQLMRSDGTIVNGRDFDSCSLSSLTLVLSGADLACFGPSDDHERVVSFQAAYDSTLGSDLPLTEEGSFSIEPLLGQVDESEE